MQTGSEVRDVGHWIGWIQCDEQLGVISILLMTNLEGASDHSDG